MNKKEAAEFLGVSTRAVERYVERGRLSVRLQKGKRGNEAVYERDEVERLKAELIRRRTRARQSVLSTDRIDDLENRLISSIEIQAASSKLLLTLADCQRLTGLSKDFLEEAIRLNKLSARTIEQEPQIRRVDLELFVNKMYSERQRGSAIKPKQKHNRDR